MTNDLGPGFCGTCGEPFTTGAALDAHQLATGHELDQPDHPLRQPERGRSIRPVIEHALTAYYDGNTELARTLIDRLLTEQGAK
jgi:hypothetical protein